MDAIAVGSKPRLSHHSVFSKIGFELINMGYKLGIANVFQGQIWQFCLKEEKDQGTVVSLFAVLS